MSKVMAQIGTRIKLLKYQTISVSQTVETLSSRLLFYTMGGITKTPITLYYHNVGLQNAIICSKEAHLLIKMLIVSEAKLNYDRCNVRRGCVSQLRAIRNRNLNFLFAKSL